MPVQNADRGLSDNPTFRNRLFCQSEAGMRICKISAERRCYSAGENITPTFVRRTLVAVILSLATCRPSSAQAIQSELDLQVVPSRMVAGVPDSITFALINKSNHDIRLPAPTPPYVSSYRGSIVLYFKFVPAMGSTSSPCSVTAGFGDTYLWPAILDRIKDWTTLKPGESLRINEERASTVACEQSMGSYTFWAEYDPPSLSGEDREVLKANNISVPVQAIVSPKITFLRSNKRPSCKATAGQP